MVAAGVLPLGWMNPLLSAAAVMSAVVIGLRAVFKTAIAAST
jgi:hypothetical protein